MSSASNPLVIVLMGSKSDWETMRHADEMLSRFSVPHECRCHESAIIEIYSAEDTGRRNSKPGGKRFVSLRLP